MGVITRMTGRFKLLSLLIAVALLASIAFSLYALTRPVAEPDIQGVFIHQGREIPGFQLTDHRQQAFTRDDLLGQWHLLSYGFTHCPDICPVALSAKAGVARRVEQEAGEYGDLGLLFYSVDPKRDTPQHLSDYVSYFHPEMTGLTLAGKTGEAHEPFEQGLGIVYEIPEYDASGEPYSDDNYPVNHGVKVFLLNPQGRLQAVFEPEYNEQGRVHLSSDQLTKDYLAVRRYLDSQ